MAKNRYDAAASKLDPRQPIYVVQNVFEKARAFLKLCYGIDDLTLIEAVHLRRLAIDATNRANEAHCARRSAFEMFSPHHDTAYRWLLELYGLHFADIVEVLHVDDLTTCETFTVLWPAIGARSVSPIVMQHFNDLFDKRGQGHQMDVRSDGVGSGFKQYIQLLRERAHNP